MHAARALAFGSCLGCPSSDEGVGGGDSESDGTGSTTTSSTTSVTLTTASTTMPATSTTEAASTSETSDTSAETDGRTTSDATGSGDATGSTTDEPSTGTGTGTTGEPAAGVCVESCREDQDCCPLGAVFCPSEEYPNNYACNDGVCGFGGCAENADCESILSDDECHPIDGIGTCFEPCEDDNDCAEGECIGTADDGTMYCTTEEPPCEEDADCDGLGVCNTDSGVCYCESSDQCEDPVLDACDAA